MDKQIAEKMYVLKTDFGNFDVARLSKTEIDRINNNPRNHWNKHFRPDLLPPQKPEQLLGSMAHHLTLTPGLPFPWKAGYAPVPGATLSTLDELRAACAEAQVGPDAPKFRKSWKKQETIDWMRSFAPALHARVEEVERAAWAESNKGATEAPPEMIGEAMAMAEYTRPVLEAELQARGIPESAAVFEHKIITDMMWRVGEGTEWVDDLSIRFSCVPDMYVLPDGDRPLTILELKTYSPKAIVDWETACKYAMRDLGVYEQLELYRNLISIHHGLDLNADAVLLCHLVPKNAYYNTSIWQLDTGDTSEIGAAWITRGLDRWWECVRAFGGMVEERPWRIAHTSYQLVPGEAVTPVVQAGAPDDEAPDDGGFF